MSRAGGRSTPGRRRNTHKDLRQDGIGRFKVTEWRRQEDQQERRPEQSPGAGPCKVCRGLEIGLLCKRPLLPHEPQMCPVFLW